MVSKPGAKTVPKGSVAGRITLEGVGFTYPMGETPVLSEINLEVEAGSVVALVGRSGAGKTTLCNLIARFYDPTEGSIKLDGVDLLDIDVESYRRLLGIVEQDVFLFDGTIAENIAYASRRPTMAEIEQAARVANADEFIESFPDGYQTLIGERGVRLSGGQRQRLAIARAVLADPVIFILDEATSNLDSKSERLIQSALTTLMQGRTSFVIAHRLSTVRSADLILVLDQGSIIEAGTHEELFGLGGSYREMVELQSMEG
jgi:ATP-binding cassette subfamily B protein/subfamily B ATP-binding cassette protein MsbA